MDAQLPYASSYIINEFAIMNIVYILKCLTCCITIIPRGNTELKLAIYSCNCLLVYGMML